MLFEEFVNLKVLEFLKWEEVFYSWSEGVGMETELLSGAGPHRSLGDRLKSLDFSLSLWEAVHKFKEDGSRLLGSSLWLQC